ncbi:MAG TPA: hypothetical protein VME22_31840 [Solirubrobacteraceae bacterium]|nr:hypothetical protein [Solirubrobacteraceae bacterium]
MAELKTRCCATSDAPVERVRETVREKYAEAAKSAACGAFRQARTIESESGSGDSDFYCCSPADRTGGFGSALYDEAQREQLPDTAVEASLGCAPLGSHSLYREGVLQFG